MSLRQPFSFKAPQSSLSQMLTPEPANFFQGEIMLSARWLLSGCVDLVMHYIASPARTYTRLYLQTELK